MLKFLTEEVELLFTDRTGVTDERGSCAVSQAVVTVSITKWKCIALASSDSNKAESLLAPKYTVLERLAVGGMAELFLAEREGLHGFRKKVVIKKMLPQYASDEMYIQMFLDEARLVARLNHASIVQVFDIGQGDDGIFFTMEYVDGFVLSEILQLCAKRKRPLQVEEVLAIVIPVAEALEHAHASCDDEGKPMELVHRDVSPSNVIVTVRGRVKLLDFGVAKSNSQVCKTVGNSVKGKFGYMAPEQTQGLPLDKRCDIFSFGVVFWELLTGKRLFPGGIDHVLLKKILHEDAPPPSSVRASIHPELDAICAKALAREPDERYSDLREFLDDIVAFEASMKSARTHRTLTTMIETLFPQGRVSQPLSTEESARLSVPLAQTDVGAAHVLDTPTSSINQELQKLQREVAKIGGMVDAKEAAPTKPKHTKVIALVACLVGALALVLFILTGDDSKPTTENTVSTVLDASSEPKEEPLQTDKFRVTLNVEPTSASIEIDGMLVGTGSYSSEFLDKGGIHQIRVFAEGYKEYRTTFEDRAPEQLVVLVPSPSIATVPVIPAEDNSKRRRPKGKRSSVSDSSLKTKTPEVASVPREVASPPREVASPPREVVKPKRPKTEEGQKSDNLDPWNK